MSLYHELKRRNVFRVAIAYLALAWLLTEVAGTVFPVFGIPDWGVRFVVIVFALGFVPALVISWVYELTPEGIKREEDVVRDASITHLTAKRLDVFTIGLIVVAVAFIVADRLWLDKRFEEPTGIIEVETGVEQIPQPESAEPQYPPNSIAVLPFVNLSSDPEQEYFSDGLSEELLNLLANIPELRVISRSSSFTFKGEKTDIPTVATKLNVALVLEGSVRKVGNQVRITAQLIEASSDTHLWSETYDRELENIFAVQDEISVAIVAVLKESLGLELEVSPRVISTVNPEAHDAYLRGRHLLVQRTRSTVEGAAREFEEAIALDPDFALAHAELAMAILLQRSRSYGELTTAEALSRAADLARRALALDPALAEAQLATAAVMRAQGNKNEARTYSRQAIQINPNYSRAYTALAGYLQSDLGRYDEAFTLIETALQLDPLSWPANAGYFSTLIQRNQLAEAEQLMERIEYIHPRGYKIMRSELNSRGGQWANHLLSRLETYRVNSEIWRPSHFKSRYLVMLGLDKEALTISAQSRGFDTILRMLGKTKEAVIAAEASLAEDPMNEYLRPRLGLALAAAGEYERARPILEEAWQQSDKRVTNSGLFDTNLALALIAIRRDAGEEAEASELLMALRDNVRRFHEAGIVDPVQEGAAAYLSGEHERGLALIAKGAEEGFFILPNEAYLQVFYDDPGFALILAAQEARQTRERNRFLAIVCNDSPYEEVWQPAEGTCERFAEESRNRLPF